MGNKSSNMSNTLLHDNWVTANQPTSTVFSHINLYRTRLLINTVTRDYIEQYMVHLISEQEFNNYLKETQWRQGLQHREPSAYIPPVRAFMNTSTAQLCNRSYTASIYFDRVQMRLAQINDIPFQDELYMLRICLEGFKVLMEHFGYFRIGQDQIFINSDGEVKVWIHPNLASVIPNKQQKYFKHLQPQFENNTNNNAPQHGNSKPVNRSITQQQIAYQKLKLQNSSQHSHQSSSIHDNTYLHLHTASYKNSNNNNKKWHNTSTSLQLSQQSMLLDILNILQSNIDKQTTGSLKLFSEYVRQKQLYLQQQRIRQKQLYASGGDTGRYGSNSHTYQYVTLQKNRINTISSTNNHRNRNSWGLSSSTQIRQGGSQKFRKDNPHNINKIYSFDNILRLYQEYVQQNTIVVPRKMQVISNIYKTQQPSYEDNKSYDQQSIKNKTANFKQNNRSSSSNKNSLMNSKPSTPPNNINLNRNNYNNNINQGNSLQINRVPHFANTIQKSKNNIIYNNLLNPRQPTILHEGNVTTSLYAGHFDQSAVVYIDNNDKVSKNLDNNKNTATNTNRNATKDKLDEQLRQSSKNFPTYTNTNTNTNINTNNNAAKNANINASANSIIKGNVRQRITNLSKNKINLERQKQKQRQKDIGSSLHIVQVNSDDQLKARLYTASNATNTYSNVTNNNNQDNNNRYNTNLIQPLNNNNNNNQINTVNLKLRDRQKATHPRRLLTEPSEYTNVNYPSKQLKNFHSMQSPPPLQHQHTSQSPLPIQPNTIQANTKSMNSSIHLQQNNVQIVHRQGIITKQAYQNRNMGNSAAGMSRNNSVQHNMNINSAAVNNSNNSIKIMGMNNIIGYNPYANNNTNPNHIKLNYNLHTNNNNNTSNANNNTSTSSVASNNKISFTNNELNASKKVTVVTNNNNNIQISTNNNTNATTANTKNQIYTKYHSPLSTLLQQKYQHGKIVRTNQNPHIQQIRHTSNQSNSGNTRSSNANTLNINAIKYVKTPFITLSTNDPNSHADNSKNLNIDTHANIINTKNTEINQQSSNSFKPSSVNISSNINSGNINNNYISNVAQVEKYIRQPRSNQQSSDIVAQNNNNIVNIVNASNGNSGVKAVELEYKNYNNLTNVLNKGNANIVKSGRVNGLTNLLTQGQQPNLNIVNSPIIANNPQQKIQYFQSQKSPTNINSIQNNTRTLRQHTHTQSILPNENRAQQKNKKPHYLNNNKQKDNVKYYTSSESYELDSEIAGDLADINQFNEKQQAKGSHNSNNFFKNKKDADGNIHYQYQQTEGKRQR